MALNVKKLRQARRKHNKRVVNKQIDEKLSSVVSKEEFLGSVDHILNQPKEVVRDVDTSHFLTQEDLDSIVPDDSQYVTKEELEELIKKINRALAASASGGGTSANALDRIEALEKKATMKYKKLLDQEGNVLYFGEALPSSSPSAPVWRIQRIVDTTTGSNTDTDICWANGSADFIHSWDDRLTYTYS